MARTTSATQRGSYVRNGAMAAAVPEGRGGAQRHIMHLLSSLGKGDTLRGFATATALLLTSLAVLEPRLDPLVLSTTLFLAGAALALFASGGTLPPLESSVAATPTEPRAIEPTPLANRPAPHGRLLGELLAFSNARSAPDLAAWTQLTHRMSHELRTPLNAVLGFSELMTAEVFGPLGNAQYADYAQNIHASGRMLLKSAEDALAITSLLTAAGRKDREAAASLRTGLDDALEFLSPTLAARGLRIDGAIDPVHEVVAEPQTLRQILINLLAEASERAAPGAELGVGIIEKGEEIAITFRLSDVRSQIGPQTRSQTGNTPDSFSLLLARTLCQLCGARLEEECTASAFLLSARFTRAAQSDFFRLH